MWVVKLGGSLFDSPLLLDWLGCLARAEIPLVVVPGGGPFADQVRAAQKHWDFEDACAHEMALLAMEQMGRMLCGLNPGLLPADELDSIRYLSDRGRIPVWLPSKDVLADPQIGQDWTVTSDSLAAWLAGKLGAQALLLVKSAELLEGLADGSADLAGLQQSGVLDGAFHRYAQELDCPVWMMHRADHETLPSLLCGRTATALSVSY
jgi:aspartokinase-like uncharacterized kinase